jgi:hypothetical protein
VRDVESETAEVARHGRRERGAVVVLELDDDAMRIAARERIPRGDQARDRRTGRKRRIDARTGGGSEEHSKEQGGTGVDEKTHAPVSGTSRATRMPAK